MKKIIAVIFIVLTLGFTGCSSEQPGAQDVPYCGGDWSSKAGCVVEIDYNGSPLTCISYDLKDGVGLTCDFVAYHNGTNMGVNNP